MESDENVDQAMDNSANLVPQRILGFFARFEGAIAIFFLTLLAALKLVCVFTLRIDSDETQHLHVVWGWANGFIPYRDFFDNHSPLFQVLCVPLFRALGERADIVIAMRLAMVPLYFLCLWCIYRCGTILFSRRIGIWTAVLTGAYPIFFVKSTEFRTDDLWALLWLLSVLALVKRPLELRNAFLTGLALGASFATSMKTSALVISLSVALIVILASKAIGKTGLDWKRLMTLATAALFGALLIPALVVAFFARKEALPSLYYCVIQHNVVPGLFRPDLAKRVLLLVPLTALACVGGYLSWRNAIEATKRDRIALIALTSIAFCMLLGVLWPLVEPHDVLPIVPLVFLLVVSATWTLLESVNCCQDYRFRSIALPLVAGGEIVALLLFYPLRPRALRDTITMIANVQILTSKSDFVMDAKGETIFRRRPFYYVLEGVTLRRLELGLIKDEIPEHLIATRAPVATVLRMPSRARSFIEQNYLPVAFRIRVLGKMLSTSDQEFPKKYEFDIVIPANYELLPERGNLVAFLDGTPFDGPRYLPAGHHEIRSLTDTDRLAVIWSVAPEKGFSPFSPLAKDAVEKD